MSTVLSLINNNSSVPSYKTLGERVEISSVSLNEDICVRLCRAIDSDAGASLSIVDLSYNKLGPALSERIANALESAPNLTQVILRYNNIGQEGCDALASVVSVSSKLDLIDVRGNKLTADNVRKLLRAVSMSTSITKIGLASNDLGAKGAALVSACLEKNNFVTFLDLRENDVTVEGVCHIVSLVESPICSLKYISLYGNRLCAEGVIKIANAVSKNRCLEVLDIGNNNASDGACPSLCQTLKTSAITQLDLCNNAITSKGLSILLSGSTKLTRLVLSGNPLGRESADILVKSFVHDSEIRCLELWSCGLESHGAIRLSGLIAVSDSLEELNLAGNNIDDSGASAIAKAIAHPSKALRVLNVVNNHIGNAGAAELIEASEKNKQIDSVSLSGNSDLNRVLQRKLDDMLQKRRQKVETFSN